MKFSNGFWLLQDDVEIYSPMEVRDARQEENTLVLYGPAKKITGRGDTLNLPQITVEVSSPFNNVIKVKMYHLAGAQNKGPFFELSEENKSGTTKISPDKSVSYRSGDLEFRISDGNIWNTEFLYKDDVKTGSPFKAAGFIKKDDGSTFFREQLNLDAGETIYGLGERFTAFVKNGQVADMWNEDGGTSSEQSYKNIPFYLSSKGYGVFVNHPEKVSFEVGSESVSRVQFSVPGEYLEYFLIAGENMKDVLSNYTRLTGRPALPPPWSFGLWLTTSFTTSYDEKTVNSFIDGMAERDIPLQVFHFDCFWMKEFQWCDFEWDKDVFPDPEGMLKRLKEKGLKNCLWINPYIAQKSILFKEGMEKGYLVKKADGSVWQWDLWQAGMAYVDFTNPEATEWYKTKLRGLVSQGVDSFKTDFGERIPLDVVYFDGSDPVKMHNYYPYLYNKAVYEVLEETKGKDDAMLFARSATVGGQKFPVHWGGDCSATYPSMAESIRGGLSLCLSGFGFWSHDISGFEQTAEPDLYKRWAAFGLLSTHSRLHGSESYRVPWNFDEEAVDVLRFFTKLKNRLMPYLFHSACETAESGVPMMRAMVLEFPDDPACAYLDSQYMLGENLLVAPIFNKEGMASYYLPEGKWISLIDGSGKTGGKWYREPHSYKSIPLFARNGSIVAINPTENKTEYNYADDVVFNIYNLAEGETTETVVNQSGGSIVLSLKVSKKAGQLEYSATGSIKNWKIRNHELIGDTVKTVEADLSGKNHGTIELEN